jgi:hypothetical protein
MAIGPSDGIALAMMLGRFRHRPLIIVLLTEIASGLPGALLHDDLFFIVLLKIPDAIFLLSLGLILGRYDYEINIHKTKNIIILFLSTLAVSLSVSFFQTGIVALFYKINLLSVYMSEAAAN